MRRLLAVALAAGVAAGAVIQPHNGGGGGDEYYEDFVHNGLGSKTHWEPRPPMGYNTWNAFRCDLDLLNESNLRRTARVMNETGLVAAGYRTFVIDDCWSVKTGRDPITEQLIADPDRFPSGMAAFGKFVKSLGMRFGMYTDEGSLTCERYPGSLGHEEIDMNLFASWGVDYLKVDGCFNKLNNMKGSYSALSRALESTGRPVTLSCSWPAYASGTADQFDYKYLASICDTWRPYFDIAPDWRLLQRIMDHWAKWQRVYAVQTKAGTWNDPDFLQIGHPQLTLEEGKSQLAVWSIIAAPLILSINVLEGMDPKHRQKPWLSSEVITALTNPEIIAMNQEYPPRQGLRIATNTSRDIWARPMNDGSLCVVVVNRGNGPASIHLNWKELVAMLDGVEVDTPRGGSAAYFVRDMWARHDIGVVQGGVSLDLASHGSAALRLRRATGHFDVSS